jgi:hypothetical protein
MKTIRDFRYLQFIWLFDLLNVLNIHIIACTVKYIFVYDYLFTLSWASVELKPESEWHQWLEKKASI